MKINNQRRRNLLTPFQGHTIKVETYQKSLVVIALIVILIGLRSARHIISVSSYEPSNRANNDVSAIDQLVSPETAAARLQDPLWIDNLVHNVRKPLFGRKRRVLEWAVKNPPSNGVELFLMPHQFRSTHLIDLFLDGRVEATMGENIAMMGWAKAVLALGCKKVVMFESYVDFVAHLDRSAFQFYILDYLSLPVLKDDLLLDPLLKQRTWEFAWWGRSQDTLEKVLQIPRKYDFQLDHALLPFNYTGDDIDKSNMRMAILPTAITFNHQPRTSEPQLCDAFFMGKSVEDMKKLIPVIKLVEDKLYKDKHSAKDLRLCTAFQIPNGSSYAKELGFRPKYTVNTGRMKPPVFAHIVGNAKVVIGSGWPLASPTIVDAIFGGSVFMAPTSQFLSMEMHPLFIETDEILQSPEEQADKIMNILRANEGNQMPFGGHNDTSYSLEYACGRLLEVIHKSFLIR